MPASDPCLICGTTPTVKSHLLPAAIGRDVSNAGQMFIGTDEHEGRLISQSGTFDYILCADHEEQIHDYEDYAITFAREFELSDDEKRIGGFVRQAVDDVALTRFACSVLWRYAVSRRPEARGVVVGPWKAALERVTFNNMLTDGPEVMLFALRWPDGIRASGIALPPSSSRLEGRRVWGSVTNGLGFMVKLDKQRFASAAARAAVLKGSGTVVGGVKEPDDDFIQSILTVTSNINLGGRLRPKA